MTHLISVLDESKCSTYAGGLSCSADREADGSPEILRTQQISRTQRSVDRAPAEALQQSSGDTAVVSEPRLEKVAVLKAAIESGTYQVPAAALADKLIESLLR